MLDETFTIRDDFPPVGYEQWRELVEATLQGASFERKLVTHTYEGIDLQPIYARSNQAGTDDAQGLPGFTPFVRGSRPLGAVLSGWDLCQEHAQPDLAVCNGQILDDLRSGVNSLRLIFDAAARQGLNPGDLNSGDLNSGDSEAADLAGQLGVMIYSVDDLDAVLKDVRLDSVGVMLDAGAAFLPAAATLGALWRRRETAPREVQGAFNADPLAVLAQQGWLPVEPAGALAQMADLARWTAKHYPHVTAVGVDTAPYHHAGATAAQDIAFSMATAVEYLRAMTSAELDVEAAASQIRFRMRVGTHHFLSIAKLRAARRLWARVIEASGGSPAAGAMQMQAQVSNRVLTQRDPYVNLLRNTVGVFSASLGGADTITSVPLDHLTGLPDEFSRRIARNTVLILQEEAHLHQVIDPAGGSWYLDHLTDQVAEKGWEIFQEIEQRGGMLQGMLSGWVATQIDSAYAPRSRDIAHRKEGITGVSEFPNIHEERIDHPPPDIPALRKAASDRLARTAQDDAIVNGLASATDQTNAAVDAASSGASLASIAQGLGFRQTHEEVVAPLEPRCFAEPFEALRDASDRWLAANGLRPRVFLANLGSAAHHTARATYAKNFFEAGGFEVLGNDGWDDPAEVARAFAASEASIAVICSSDKLYPELVPQVAPQLKSAGARAVVLAGRPGEQEDAWRDAGVDRFIFMGCDVLATLKNMLDEEGVLTS